MKTCLKCKDTKPLTDFPPSSQSKDGKLPNCRTCMREYHSARHKRETQSIDGIFNVDAEMRYLTLDVPPNYKTA